MKKPEIKISKTQLKKLTGKTSWEKALYLTLALFLLALLLGNVYLLFRPLDENVRTIVQEEINSSNIIFNKKVLDNLKNRQQPQQVAPTATGKNPFLNQ